MTLREALAKLPLRTFAAQMGVKIIGEFNSQNFIEFENEVNGEFDRITVNVEDPEVEPIGSSALDVPSYRLMPCEELTIVLRLERHQLRNRPERPCRTDFPPDIAKMHMKSLPPDVLYNAIFAPSLPYDQALCHLGCQAKYWLPICSCYVNFPTFLYAGMPNDSLACPMLSEGEKH